MTQHHTTDTPTPYDEGIASIKADLKRGFLSERGTEAAHYALQEETHRQQGYQQAQRDYAPLVAAADAALAVVLRSGYCRHCQGSVANDGAFAWPEEGEPTIAHTDTCLYGKLAAALAMAKGGAS